MTSDWAGIYARNMLLGLYMQALFDLFRKFFIMLGQPVMPMVIQGATIPVHILLCYFLVRKLDLNVAGVGLATNLTFFLNFILILIAAFYYSTTKQCLTRVISETYKRLWEYFTLGLPTALMVCFDMWAFSFMTFIAHFLGDDDNAGQVILLNIISLLYSIPLGFSSGACALVGRNVGKGKIANAKMYQKQVLFLVVLVSLIPCISFAVMPRQIIMIFTS